MEIFSLYPTVGSTAGGVVLGLLLGRTRNMQVDTEAMRKMRVRAAESFEAADRVLSNEQTPPMIRVTLIMLLTCVSDMKFAQALVDGFRRPSSTDRANSETSIGDAVEQLRREHPELADDAQSAIFGLLSVLTSLAVHSGVRFDAEEAAFHPRRMFAKLQALLPKSSASDASLQSAILAR